MAANSKIIAAVLEKGSIMQKKLSMTAVIAVFSAMAFSVTPAYAYLDYGTGSMILQALIGGIVGGMIAIKVYWHKVKGFFSSLKNKPDGKTD